MKAISFAIGKYTSRRTGEVSDKIIVKFDNATEQMLWCNLPEFADKSIPECVAIIKPLRDKYLSRVVVAESVNYPGSYQAMFSSVEVSEEF
jgi:hypothetical protein